MTCKLATKIGIAGQEFLFDHDGMAETPRCIAKFRNSEASVAVVHAQKGDALESELGVDVPRERISLHAVVLKIGEVPGDDGFRNGRIGGRAVDERRFGFQRKAKSDVGGFAS